MPLTFHVGKYFLFFAMTLMLGTVSFFYLMKFTEIHTKGYQLRKLELEHDKLITAQQAQNTEIARLRSLVSIKESAMISHMVPARNTIFLTSPGAVASLPSYAEAFKGRALE